MLSPPTHCAIYNNAPRPRETKEKKDEVKPRRIQGPEAFRAGIWPNRLGIADPTEDLSRLFRPGARQGKSMYSEIHAPRMVMILVVVTGKGGGAHGRLANSAAEVLEAIEVIPAAVQTSRARSSSIRRRSGGDSGSDSGKGVHGPSIVAVVVVVVAITSCSCCRSCSRRSSSSCSRRRSSSNRRRAVQALKKHPSTRQADKIRWPLSRRLVFRSTADASTPGVANSPRTQSQRKQR